MKIKQLLTLFKSWKDLNQTFLKKQIINSKTPSRKIKYTSALLEKIKKEVQPVFFLSTGRCGTRFIANILEKDIFLDVYHHAKPQLTYFQQNAFENPDSEKIHAIAEASRLEYIIESYRRNRIYIETNNRLTFLCYGLKKVFPQAKFVHLVRHPGDFVRSGLRRNWYKGEAPMDMGRLRPAVPSNKWEKYSQIEKISWLWNETNTFIEEFKEKKLSPVLTIKSEQLFSDFEKIRLLIDFIGLNNISKKMKNEFHRPANAQVNNRINVYERWNEEEKNQLKKIATLSAKYDYRI